MKILENNMMDKYSIKSLTFKLKINIFYIVYFVQFGILNNQQTQISLHLVQQLKIKMVRIIQNYTLYDIIGEGAYGKVYRAINKNDNMQYAVKVIQVKRFKQNKKLEECTVNEINILTNIEKHEHIIKYIDMLKTPNNFYFVYEYCNGGTLESVLKKQTCIPQNKALLIFKQLIDAFQVLNKYNIMHRDLKPDNIFFSNGIVKLGDFGFCKSLQKTNMTKTMLGSPIYMAPQILRGQIYSTKADIWSLGVVLYEMIYGFCPFESTTIPKLLEVLKQTELQFSPKIQISEQLKRLLKKLLTKDPTKRIQWMQLLRINISNDGRLVTNNKDKVSLVDDENTNLFQSQKMVSSTKDLKNYKKQENTVNHYTSQEVIHTANTINNENGGGGMSFFKKKNSTQANKRNSVQQKEETSPIFSSQNIKAKILKQHSQNSKCIQLAVDLLKSGNTSGSLFSYLLLKKVEQKLIILRDQIATMNQYQNIMLMLNGQLKQISIQLSKNNINQSLSNWKSLIKSTGEFHRSFKAFYMMVVYLSGDVPKQDLTHIQMQIDVRNRLS